MLKKIKLISFSIFIIYSKCVFATSDIMEVKEPAELYQKAWNLRFTQREEATKYLLRAVELEYKDALYCYSRILGGSYPENMFSIPDKNREDALKRLYSLAKNGYKKAEIDLAFMPLTGLYGNPKLTPFSKALETVNNKLKEIQYPEALESIEYLSNMSLGDLKDCYGY